MRYRVQQAWWYRTLTALFGMWLMAATTELISTHSCPMHDGLVPTEGEHAAHMNMSHAQMSHTNMSHTNMSHAQMTHDAMPATHQMPVGHVCVCIDTCSAASASMPVLTTVSDIVATLLDAANVETIARLSPRVSWIDYFIPFSTAPPMTVRA